MRTKDCLLPWWIVCWSVGGKHVPVCKHKPEVNWGRGRYKHGVGLVVERKVVNKGNNREVPWARGSLMSWPSHMGSRQMFTDGCRGVHWILGPLFLCRTAGAWPLSQCLFSVSLQRSLILWSIDQERESGGDRKGGMWGAYKGICRTCF